MFGSIFVGLSGMNAFSSGLKQISNNITNINTTGFKASGLKFSDLFGMSQHDVGQGVSLSDPRLDFKQGELRQSDRDLDLAVDGEGFLVLLKDSEMQFTRTGSFEVDSDGYVVLANSKLKLAVLDELGNPVSVSINAYRTSPPQATTTIKFVDNLSSTSTAFNLSDIEVFDAQGASDKWKVRFERTATSAIGEWIVIVQNSGGTEIGRQALKFNNGVIDPTAAKLAFAETSSGRSATLDFSSNVTSFSSGEVSTLKTVDVDGHGIGDITAIRVNDKGVLEIAYSNEQTKALGSVALASFQDPQSLEQRDDGLFVHQSSRGIQYLTSEHASVGRVLSRRTEASNVDLSKEFGDLILVQRGFQASSQVVSVSNDMIQQLFGIRGQG